MRFLASNLRHKVTLERPALAPDSGGGYAQTWEEAATLWAAITRLRAGERYTNGQLTVSASHIFRLRYTSDITADMRFIFDGRAFNIRGIQNVDEKNRMLEVYAEEGI